MEEPELKEWHFKPGPRPKLRPRQISHRRRLGRQSYRSQVASLGHTAIADRLNRNRQTAKIVRQCIGLRARLLRCANYLVMAGVIDNLAQLPGLDTVLCNIDAQLAYHRSRAKLLAYGE